MKNLWFLRFLCLRDWQGCIFFRLGYFISLGYFCFLLFLLLILLKPLENHRDLYAILGNPKIFSAMAMAMSIYRTLCVLVSLGKTRTFEEEIKGFINLEGGGGHHFMNSFSQNSVFFKDGFPKH